MVLPAIAAGAGLSALGGALSGIAGDQRGSAERGALRGGLAGLRAAGRQREASNERTQGQLSGLQGELQALNQQRIGAFGPGQQAARTAGIEQAGGRLADARSAINLPATFQSGTPMAQSLGVDASRAAQGRIAPQSQLAQLQLGELLSRVPMARTQMGINETGADIGRRSGEVLSDDAIRRELINRQIGGVSNQLAANMDDAQYAGRGLAALGQLGTSFAPVLTQALARPAISTPAGFESAAPDIQQAWLAAQQQNPTLSRSSNLTGAYIDQLLGGVTPPSPYRRGF